MVVFVYGTLRDHGVLASVVGHNAIETKSGWIDNFSARLAHGHHFPMLRPREGSRAEGMLLLNLTVADLDALDAFEGETYQRQRLTVFSDDGTYQADVYIDDGRYQDGGEFILSEWEENHRDLFINSFMEGRGFDRPE